MKGGRQIARSAGLVGLLTLASRVLGLVRDAVVAAWFSRRATDAYFVANTIPNVLRRLLAEGSLTVAFIPVFTEYWERRGEGEARQMLRNMLGTTLVVLTVVVGLGVGLAPWVVRGFASGLSDDPGKFDLTVLLTRVMFPFLMTVSLGALAMGALNTRRHFAAPSLSPVLLNLGIILSVALGTGLAASMGLPRVMSAAVGVVVGGVAQLLVQMPFLRRHGVLVWPAFDPTHPGVLRVGALMLPSVFGLAIYELNIIIARQFASYLAEGSISYLYYAARLIEFPMGMFAAAMATVAMPNLSSHAAAGEIDQVKQTYRYALRMVFFIILPATAGLAALALPLTSVLFQRGLFTHAMAAQTAHTLLGFLVGLWAGAGVRQTVPVFYALQDTRTPVKVAAGALCVYGAGAWALYRPLQTFGLALAVACSSIFNFLMLMILLRKKLGLLGMRSVAGSVARSAVASVCCGAAAWGAASRFDWSEGGGRVAAYPMLLAAVIVGSVVYAAACKLLKVPELDQILSALGIVEK